MSRHQAFRRQPMPGQFQQSLKTINIAAPTRGIIQNENEAFTRPGAAIVQDNWLPTMRGVKLRGGFIRHCTLPETTPVISAFRYVGITGTNQRMFAANATKLYDVTAATPTLVKSGQTSGNWVASMLTNLSGNWMLATNEAGDGISRFDGTAWVHLTTELTAGPVPGTSTKLSYVCTYRNRFFFIEAGSMNLWYLPIDSHQGALVKIPLTGAGKKGGHLKFLADWSIDAGDGIDNKLVACTSEGELLVMSGSDPTTWQLEGRYEISAPMGMNAHMQMGGDLLVATVEGIVPVSQALQKEAGQLDLAAISYPIKNMWRTEVAAKRSWAWTMTKWDQYGGIFVTWPGGPLGNQYCAVINSATGAWARFVGWDAVCFVQLNNDMFFGTQQGKIMQADRTGMDDGEPYTCTLVGGWELFQSGAGQVVWHQARASFVANQPFEPQLAATTDYFVELPPPPSISEAPPLQDVWDQGKWGPGGSELLDPPPPADIAAYAQWDAPYVPPAMRNTLWVSIGMTGYSHAPIVQAQIWQEAKPDVELIAIACTYEPAGINV